jgi:hypothetical protein
MRAFIVRVRDLISPLGELARDTWLYDTTLGKAMERTLREASLEPETVDSPEDAEARARAIPDGAIVVHDSVGFSPRLLREFLRLAQAAGERASLKCGIARSVASDTLSHVSGLERATVPGKDGDAGPPTEVWTAPLHFIRGPVSLSDATVCVVPHEASVLRRSAPKGLIAAGEIVYGLSDTYLCNVSHWVHVLRLNVTSLVVPWSERRRFGYSILGIAWYLWRALLAFPFTGGRLAEAFRMVHWRARLHRSVHVEGSVIAKDVEIGVNAIIKYSYIGEGARIEDGAHIVGSVIGPGTFVGRSSVIVGSLLCPGSFAAQQLMQLSLLGPEAIALTTSNFFDVNLGKNVRVAYRGGYVDSGDQALGACLGPRARIGGGVWIASGREVPADALLVKDPAEVAFSMGEIGKDPAVTRGGVVQPLRMKGGNDPKLSGGTEG